MAAAAARRGRRLPGAGEAGFGDGCCCRSTWTPAPASWCGRLASAMAAVAARRRRRRRLPGAGGWLRRWQLLPLDAGAGAGLLRREAGFGEGCCCCSTRTPAPASWCGRLASAIAVVAARRGRRRQLPRVGGWHGRERLPLKAASCRVAASSLLLINFCIYVTAPKNALQHAPAEPGGWQGGRKGAGPGNLKVTLSNSS